MYGVVVWITLNLARPKSLLVSDPLVVDCQVEFIDLDTQIRFFYLLKFLQHLHQLLLVINIIMQS